MCVYYFSEIWKFFYEFICNIFCIFLLIQILIVYEIISYFEGEEVDLVICDGVLDVIGFYDIDEYI